MTITKLIMLLWMSWVLAACGGESAAENETSNSDDSTAEEGETTDDTLDDTASEVIKTLADVNGFKIVTETFNPRGYDYYGTEVKISAFVKDHSNNPVADGTVVTFVADDNGLIEEQCATEGGTCSVTWTSARDRNQPIDPDANPGPGYTGDPIITIMARTIGEDSFIDKNANKEFDAQEVFFTQSEAFLDADDDGVYDSGDSAFDEYSDFNNNGEFDGNDSNGMFRGASCSDGAKSLGHCAERLEIWDTVRMINSSGGAVSIQLFKCDGTPISNGASIALSADNCFELLLTDVNGNVPPSGTTVSVDAEVGDVKQAPDDVPNVYETPGQGYRERIKIEGTESGETGKLTIVVESVGESSVKTDISINLTDTPAP